MNIAFSGVVPAIACHPAKAAMKKGCCCCGGKEALPDGGCGHAAVSPSYEDCGCALRSGGGQPEPEFTLNSALDIYKYPLTAAEVQAQPACIKYVGFRTTSVRDYCVFESPPFYKLTSSYLC